MAHGVVHTDCKYSNDIHFFHVLPSPALLQQEFCYVCIIIQKIAKYSSRMNPKSLSAIFLLALAFAACDRSASGSSDNESPVSPTT